MNAELKQCEFFLLRYVPDLVKDEFVNIGVVLSGREANYSGRFTDVRFTRDWSRVRCLDPGADIEMLEGIHREIEALLQTSDADREQLLRRINDSFSNSIQLSPVKACLTQSPQLEIEQLARLYLQTAKRESRAAARSARQQIFAHMQDEFEKAGVWGQLRKAIPAAQYTGAGDPLKIDCGYKPNGVVRMFHALSLTSDVDAAKVLAFSYPQIAAGIARAEHAKTELTAIIEQPAGNKSAGPLDFALETLKRNFIHVATVQQMPQIAETARRELGL